MRMRILISLIILRSLFCFGNKHVVQINDADNELAKVLATAAYNDAQNQINFELTQVKTVTTSEENLNNLCTVITEKPPTLILDNTKAGFPSVDVKKLTRQLGIPAISSSLGQRGDLKEWRDLDERQVKYLLQIMSPLDVIPEIIRSIVIKQNYLSGTVVFDSTYNLQHKLKSLLLNLPIRYTIIPMATDKVAMKEQLYKFSVNMVETFYVIGSAKNIEMFVNFAFNSTYAAPLRPRIWHLITQDSAEINCDCKNNTVVYIRPREDRALSSFLEDKKITTDSKLEALFYYELSINGFNAAASLFGIGNAGCDFLNQTPPIRNVDLHGYLEKHWNPSLDNYPLFLKENGESYIHFTMELFGMHYQDSKLVLNRSIATWRAGFGQSLEIIYPRVMEEYTGRELNMIAVVVQMPFVYPNSSAPRNFSGFCVDLMEEVGRLANIRYNLYLPNANTSDPDDCDPFERPIAEVVAGRALMSLGSISITPKRKKVVDFSVPFYDSVGITIMMKIPEASTSIFRFILVLDAGVWASILAAYFFTSFMIWIFEKFSPYSYRNDRAFFVQEKEEKKDFTSVECLWFCLNSLTPEGGGAAPGCISGRVVAGVWWLFGFVIIASYTANLAAFLTASSLEAPIGSLDDLSKQYQIKYGPINRSLSMEYFRNMAIVERELYQYWFNETVGMTRDPNRNSPLGVYEYPLKMKFEKMWKFILDFKMPQSLDEAVKWVRASRTTSEGFAFIGDATDIKYLSMTNCDLQVVGEEFSKKPYGLAMNKEWNSKESVDNAIVTLMNERILDRMEKKWWKNNPNIVKCDHMKSNGITMQNIFGVFIFIGAGVVFGCFVIILDKMYNKFMGRTKIAPVNRDN